MAVPFKYGKLQIDHPSARDREAGKCSEVWFGSVPERGEIRRTPLNEDSLLELIEDAAKFVRLLRKQAKQGRK